ncbi:DUF4158 domain-containing protein [Mesorhizobium waimense]|uniref:DUF4158 domain-containing protein n=1 Tax=Mesorhizobium waimense TaxID=1300307 RepID=UPI002679DCD3
MARRALLKEHERKTLFDIPVDEDGLIRHYSLSPADLLEIQLRRREHNQLGFAIQLCLMRYPGPLLANEVPPKAMLDYVAEQVGASSTEFRLYARREETRSNHIAHLLGYLQKRNAAAEDRRAALLSEIEVASTTDAGTSIAGAILAELRNRNSLLPAANIIERMGLAARAIARRQAERTLIEGHFV